MIFIKIKYVHKCIRMCSFAWSLEELNQTTEVLWKVFLTVVWYLEFVMYSMCSIIIKQLDLH